MGTFVRVLSAIFLFFSPFIYADVLLKAGGAYLRSKDTVSGSSSTVTRTPLDFTLGYITPKRWVFGGAYAMEKTTNSGGGGSTTVDRTSLGATLGYLSQRDVGGYAFGTYYVSSEYESPGVKYSGSGYQLDLGLKVNIRGAALGAQLSYKIFNYTLDSASESKLDQERIDPGFFLLLEF